MPNQRDSRICLFYLSDNITLLYSLYPLLRSREFRSRFEFTNSLDYVMKKSRSRNLLLVRFFKRRDIADSDEVYLRFKERFENVYYFDDTASSDEIQTTAIKHVDTYFKKQIQRDRSYYSRPSYGKRAFTDYYHQRFGIADEGNEEKRRALLPEEIRKLVPSWNLGIGIYPKIPRQNSLSRRMERCFGAGSVRFLYGKPGRYVPSRAPRKPVVSGHFGTSFDRNTVAFHRRLFLDTMMAAPEIFSCGRIPLKDYNEELRLAEATLSPFGWGEVCFRDFEAMINKSLLIKPSMEHIETWPDIYRPHETYMPVSWDASDLVAAAKSAIEDKDGSRRIAESAYAHYMDAFNALDERVRDFMGMMKG